MLLSTTNGHVYVVDAYTGRKVCIWCSTDSCEHSWNARLFLILMNLDLLLCSYMDSQWSPTWMGGFWRLHSVQMHSLSLLVCFTAPIVAQNHCCQQKFPISSSAAFILLFYIRLFSRWYFIMTWRTGCFSLIPPAVWLEILKYLFPVIPNSGCTCTC